MKPSMISTERIEKFNEKMTFLADGNHYQEMINMFRRLKVQNGTSPNQNDNILPKLWLDQHIIKARENTEEQALFEPPANIFKWPSGLKRDKDAPDSFKNQNRNDRSWTYLDPVGPGTRIPTTGAVTTNVCHFQGNIAREHNFDYGLTIYMDMKTFPPTNRMKNEAAESSSHLDSANTNQKYGDILAFTKFNPDGSSDIIDTKTWMTSYNAKRFFELNGIKNIDRERFLSNIIYFICQSRMSRSDANLSYEKAKLQNSGKDRDSAAQLIYMIKDYQALAAFSNDLGSTGTNLSIVSPSKAAFGNMIRSLNRMKRKIPSKFENWNTKDVLEKQVTESQLIGIDDEFKTEIGTLFKWPVTVFIPLRNHRIEPTHAGNFSCKYLQLVVIRSNIAGAEHYTEMNVDPMRLGNISNIFNQLATVGNLYPKFGKCFTPKGQNFEFGQYNCYNIGTVNDHKQRCAIVNHLFTNETKHYPFKFAEVLVPAKIDQILTTKKLLVTVPIQGKIILADCATQKTLTSVEGIAAMSAIIASNAKEGRNLWSVGQLPATSLGMKIDFKFLNDEAIKVEKSEFNGIIRDHVGYESVEVDYDKSHKTARLRITEIKSRKGQEWRLDNTEEQKGVVKRVFQGGANENSENINSNKVAQFHKDCIMIESQNSLALSERKEKEYSTLENISYSVLMNKQIGSLEKGR